MPAESADPTTVPAMLEHRVAHDPDAPFLLTPVGDELSYREVWRRAGVIADRLRAAGVQAGDAVGVYLGNEPAWVVAMFGCWALGAITAACGAASPPEEALRRFAIADAKAVITREGLAGAGTTPQFVVDALGAIGDDDGSIPRAARRDVARDDVAFIMFSSGTTGEAKAVVNLHGKLADGPVVTAGTYSSSNRFRPRASGKGKPPAISFNPFGQSASLGRIIFRLYVGRPVILVQKFDIDVMAELAAHHPLDTLQLAPAMIHALAYTDRSISLGALKYVNSGTAPLSSTVREDFERRYGVPVLQSYGSSEAGLIALENYEDAMAGRRGPGSVGRLVPGVELRIVDDDGRDVADGDDGELARRVPKGQEARFLTREGEADLPTEGEGWYRTGDVGRMVDGILYITGRRKEMLVVGGFNVYPAEVEEVLRQSDLVLDAVVVGLPDDRLGERPVAGIVWGPSTISVDEREAALVVHAREKLEAYKVPRRWFALDEVPLNPNLKVDRLRALQIATEQLG
ncbi:MAG: class I adenylate-forming enzyme family protein [Acidimicrobiia bacterium]